MGCYHPIAAWRRSAGGATFNRRDGYIDLPQLQLGCGQCIGCRLDRSRSWAIRCVHEAQFHAANSFLTLTYRDRDLPSGGSLDRTAFPTFIRKFRKAHPGLPVKYFHCGEYGELLERPHYHAILFGYDFPDRKHWATSEAGFAQYASAELDRLWGLGFCTTGPVTFETAAYTARYVCKKVNGPLAAAHYGDREPEFMTCSKGIGERWVERYADDTVRDDFVVARGHEQPVPRYYRKKLEQLKPSESRSNELARIVRASTREAQHERTPVRLAVRETVAKARTALSGRNL